MAVNDSTRNNDSGTFKTRMLAVLDYDGIPVPKRASHLARLCGMSVSTARRILSDSRETCPAISAHRLFEISDELNIHWCWLHNGSFERFDPRTARIQMLMIDGKTTTEADSYIGSIAGDIPGEPTYINIGRYPNGKVLMLRDVIMIEQFRRMTKWEKNKYQRMLIRLSNNDTKADRLLEMAGRGQITRHQLLGAM